MSGRAFWAAVGALMVAGCAARPNLIERSWTISLEPEPVDLSTGNEQEARRPKNAIGDPSIKTAFVISGEAAWEAIWKHAGREAPEIDFSGCFIIGTVRELSEPGILSVRITKVENTGDSLLVHIWEKWDAPGDSGDTSLK